jgi:DNA-binding response OmpR family regulator
MTPVRPDLSAVRILLAENGVIVGKSVAGAFRDLGFLDIQGVATAAEARGLLSHARIDMIALNADFDDGAGIGLVRDIRNGYLHADPFPVILMIVTRPDQARIKAALMSGADDIVVVPFLRDQFRARLKTILNSRKPFVVTHDYIGPDRRAQPRPGEATATLVAVPNPVRSRSQGESDDHYASAAKTARQRLISARLTSLGKAVQWEIRALLAAITAAPNPALVAPRVARLDGFATEMIGRIDGDSAPIRGFQAALAQYRDSPDRLGQAEAAALMEQARAIALP